MDPWGYLGTGTGYAAVVNNSSVKTVSIVNNLPVGDQQVSLPDYYQLTILSPKQPVYTYYEYISTYSGVWLLAIAFWDKKGVAYILVGTN